MLSHVRPIILSLVAAALCVACASHPKTPAPAAVVQTAAKGTATTRAAA